MSPSWRLYERLLFDEDLRAAFARDRESVLHEHGLAEVERARFRQMSLSGLAADAEGRRRYLMAALCRPYPLSAAAIGAGDPRALSRFLASPALFAPLAERSARFGDHLSGLLDALEDQLPEAAGGLIRAVLSVERAMVDNAAALRDAAGRGEAPSPPSPPSSAQLKRGHLRLPPYLLVAELPAPTELIRAALGGVGPEDVFPRLEAGQVSRDRLITVARADEQPVTVICRGVVVGQSHERAGAGGLSPLVEVKHLRVELGGRQAPLLRALQAEPTLKDLPPAREALMRRLVEAGVVELSR
ncbi:hypothetical protein L6R49_06765 [Myxococcota bacterium]|nr:hypothetical protein [Myxococcota bacterium]